MERIERNTSSHINKQIEERTKYNIIYYTAKGKSAIDKRLQELDREWDIERILQINSGGLTLIGITLTALLDKKWLLLSGIVTAFLVQQSVQGWCPPLPFFRKLMIRTRKEIEIEKNALKAIRGDYEIMNGKKKKDLSEIEESEIALQAAKT